MVTVEDASKEIVEGCRRAGLPYRSSEFILVHLPGVTSRDHCMERNTWIGQRDFTRVEFGVSLPGWVGPVNRTLRPYRQRKMGTRQTGNELKLPLLSSNPKYCHSPKSLSLCFDGRWTTHELSVLLSSVTTTYHHLIFLDPFSVVPIQFSSLSTLYPVSRQISLLTVTNLSSSNSLATFFTSPACNGPVFSVHKLLDPSIGKSLRTPFESCLVMNVTGTSHESRCPRSERNGERLRTANDE